MRASAIIFCALADRWEKQSPDTMSRDCASCELGILSGMVSFSEPSRSSFLKFCLARDYLPFCS